MINYTNTLLPYYRGYQTSFKNTSMQQRQRTLTANKWLLFVKNEVKFISQQEMILISYVHAAVFLTAVNRFLVLIHRARGPCAIYTNVFIDTVYSMC